MNASQALALLLNVLYDARRIPRHERRDLCEK
jgi:hypothetical protein